MKMQKTSLIHSLWLVFLILSCQEKEQQISHGRLTLSITDQTHIGINDGAQMVSATGPSEYLNLRKGSITDYNLLQMNASDYSDKIGTGKQYRITGLNETYRIEKTLVITVYEAFPDLATFKASYTNRSENPLPVTSWVNNAYEIASPSYDPPFWAFQGSSSSSRADWIKPIRPGYFQENFMGMNDSDYGGGIPVTDIWNRETGLTVGHLEMAPQLVALPTELDPISNTVSVGITKDLPEGFLFEPGETLETVETFVLLHDGDYYNGLSTYSTLMQAKGIEMPASEPAAYDPIWCAWGYERNFNVNEITGTLPKVKELGIKWAVLDDGFQQAEGDWHTNKRAFPKGDPQIKELVNTIHSYGLKAKLWWAPLAADPGSQLLAENPDMRLYTEDWSPQYITWWDSYYLSPSHPKTIEHTQEIVDLFLNEWDFDGLKMDGQHMNAISPDYNPESQYEGEESVAAFPEFYKLIYDQALAIKPHAVVENCPCGTCMSFFNMPYMNQAVSSDPLSSWQIRLKGKTYKALIPNTAYYGDHVELSDNGSDFASSLGIGAVLGTKFTWPKDNPTASDSYLLTPEKEVIWKQWFGLYNEKMISTGDYLGSLYDIGYDLPETHVIQKSDTLYYAFYADEWSGSIELRGLGEGNYSVRDYVNNVAMETVNGPTASINATFEDFLLIEVLPLMP